MINTKPGWNGFEWVRNGEGGGRREGYSKLDFDAMSEDDRTEALRLVLRDALKGYSFEILALRMIVGEDAQSYLEVIARNLKLPEISRAIAWGELACIRKDFESTNALVEFMEADDPRGKQEAIQYLEALAHIMKDVLINRLSSVLVSEDDETIAFRLATVVAAALSKTEISNMQVSPYDKFASRIKKLHLKTNAKQFCLKKKSVVLLKGSAKRWMSTLKIVSRGTNGHQSLNGKQERNQFNVNNAC